jgi:hypothetical protein
MLLDPPFFPIAYLPKMSITERGEDMAKWEYGKMGNGEMGNGKMGINR